jgi:hypothetical protein
MGQRQRTARREEAAEPVRLRFARRPKVPGARQPPPRCWFRAGDGTFYRNCPLIAAERDEVRAWPAGTFLQWAIVEELSAEWWRTFRRGVQRKTVLDPGDVVVSPATFREAYPDNPGLWALDDE